MADTPMTGISSPPLGGDVTDNSSAFDQTPAVPLANRIVPATPVPTPAQQDQGVPAHEDAARPHLMGRLTGRLISGLSGEHTEYSIDPNTGKSVPTTVKEKPGQVFKSILAYGLMGGQGIGPKEGEQNFSQGLLAGLGGGVRTSTDEKQKLDQQRRAQSQQDYANQLKANEEQRQNKELSMKQQLNDAAIANYTAQTSMEKFNLMKAHQENQHMAVQQMQAKDLPMLKLSEEAGIKPVKENLSVSEYQKLLSDPNSPDAASIRAHKVIPLVTNSEAHVAADGSLSWEPTVSLYPVATKYTADTLSQLKDAGMQNTPLYKDIEQKVKNGSAIEPRELLNVYKEIGQHFDYAKNRADIAEKQAQMVHSYAEANDANIRGQLGKLQLDQAKSAQQGKELFNYIGTAEGFTRTDPKTHKKETVTIPSDGNGGYNFNALRPDEKVGLRDYLDSVQNTAQLSLDKLISASKADPDNADVKAQIKQQSAAVSNLNNMANSLNGTKIPVGQLPAPVEFIDKKGNHVQAITRSDLVKMQQLGYKEAGQPNPKTSQELPTAGPGAIFGQLEELGNKIGPLPGIFSRESESNPYPGFTQGQIDHFTQQAIPIVTEIRASGEKDPVKIDKMLDAKNIDPAYRVFVWNGLGIKPPLGK